MVRLLLPQEVTESSSREDMRRSLSEVEPIGEASEYSQT